MSILPPFIDERERLTGNTDCVWASGVMGAGKAGITPPLGFTANEREALERSQTVFAPETGGSIEGALPVAYKNRYAWAKSPYTGDWAGLLGHLNTGGGAVVGGLYSVLDNYRASSGLVLGRWTSFTGRHAAYVQATGPNGATKSGYLWWMDPMADWGMGKVGGGEWAPVSAIRAFMESLSTTNLVALLIKDNEQGGSDVKFVSAGGYSPSAGKLLHVPAGTPIYGFDGSQLTTLQEDAEVACFGLADAHSGQFVIRISTAKPYPDGMARTTLAVVKSTAVPYDAPAPAPTTGHSDEELAAAKKSAAAAVSLAAANAAAQY